MLSQGYVRHGTSWRLPQEVEIEESRRSVDVADKKWRRDLRLWRRWIDRGRRDQAMEKFNVINDPLAAAGLAALMEDEELRELKLLYVEILGRLDSSVAKKPLIEAALEDKSETVRDACIDQLQKQGRTQAIAHYLRMLDPKKTKSDDEIHRAGIALGRLGNDQAVKPLIDALVYERKFVTSTGSSRGIGIGASFGDGSPGGLSVGSKPKVVRREVQNEGVLYGLKALTGEDFRFDQQAWLDWYVKQHSPEDVTLRRDG